MLKAYSGFLVRHACALASLLFASAWVSGGLLLLLGRTHFQNYGAFELLVRGAPAVDEMDLANAALKAADAWAAGSRARPRTVLSSLDSAVVLVYSAGGEPLLTPERLQARRPRTPPCACHAPLSDPIARPQAICEVDNVLLGTDGYDLLCYDGALPIPGLASRSSMSGRSCSLQLTSPTAFFYVNWQLVLAIEKQLRWLRRVSPFARVVEPPPSVSRELLLATSAGFERGSHTRSCPLLPQEYVEARAAQLLELAATGGTASANASSPSDPVARTVREQLSPLVDASAATRGHVSQASSARARRHRGPPCGAALSPHTFPRRPSQVTSFGEPLDPRLLSYIGGGIAPNDDEARSLQLQLRNDLERRFAQSLAAGLALRPPSPISSLWRGHAALPHALQVAARRLLGSSSPPPRLGPPAPPRPSAPPPLRPSAPPPFNSMRIRPHGRARLTLPCHEQADYLGSMELSRSEANPHIHIHT